MLRDRQSLAESGIIIVVITLQRFTNQLLAGPDIVSRGFVYVREAEELIEDAKYVVEDALDDVLKDPKADWATIKNAIKDNLSDYIWSEMKRRPVIIPIITEVE